MKKIICHFIQQKICPLLLVQKILPILYTLQEVQENQKGVIITHHAVTNTIQDINQKYEVNEDDRIIGISSMCFDLSVYDIFGALSTGAMLVMIRDPRDMQG